MSQPLVSIITPSYNQAEFIEATIESVLQQSYPCIEYTVIDDGSQDGTARILEQYKDNDGIRIICFEENKWGQTKTINEGWRMSQGDILAYLNSDDTYYHSDVVASAVNALVCNPNIGVVYGNSVYTDSEGGELSSYPAEPLVLDDMVLHGKNPIPQPSSFIRRIVWQDVGLLNEEVFSAMDFDFWLRVALRYEFLYAPETWSTFRLHPQSKSSKGGKRAAADFLKIYHNLAADANCPDYLKKQPKRLESCAYLWAADQYDIGLDLASFRKYVWKAWTLYPGNIRLKHLVKWIYSMSGRRGEGRLRKRRLRRFQERIASRSPGRTNASL